jgi:hypothetical protein
MQKCHLINKQKLKLRFGVTGDALWDERLWVWGCWGHHQSFDNLFLPVPFDALPAGFSEAIDELGDRAWDIVLHDSRFVNAVRPTR